MSYDAAARDGDQTTTLGLSVEMLGMLGLLVLARGLPALCFSPVTGQWPWQDSN